MQMKTGKEQAGRKITLNPLKFSDAVSALLKIKPQQKLIAKKKKSRRSI
jgi:hypothetical protein